VGQVMAHSFSESSVLRKASPVFCRSRCRVFLTKQIILHSHGHDHKQPSIDLSLCTSWAMTPSSRSSPASPNMTAVLLTAASTTAPIAKKAPIANHGQAFVVSELVSELDHFWKNRRSEGLLAWALAASASAALAAASQPTQSTLFDLFIFKLSSNFKEPEELAPCALPVILPCHHSGHTFGCTGRCTP